MVPEPLVLRVDWLIGKVSAAIGPPKASPRLQVQIQPLIDTPGRVALSTCPGRTDVSADITTDIERIRELGIGVVVSLVDDREMERYGVVGLRAALREARLRSIQFPIRDKYPPDDLAAARHLCGEILGWLGEGQNVLLHCIGGWGRSGTIAAALLCHQGYEARNAIGLVRAARSPHCIESYEQEQFVHEYARAQQHAFRFYHLTTRAHLESELTGEPSARRLRSARVPRAQLLAADELPQAVAARSAQTPLSELVIISGEVPIEGSALALLRDFPIDRAFTFDGARWLPAPLRDLLR